MAKAPHQASALARQGRTIAAVIVITALLWVLVQVPAVRGAIGERAALLVDLAALAGFLWAFIVTFGLWRRRNDARKES